MSQNPTDSPSSSASWLEQVRSLPPERLQRLSELLEPSLPKRYVPQTPTPPQAAFLALPQLEALFGGAAGPGKSSGLLMAALQYVDVPGYSALLLRRTFADLALPEALIPRADEWLRGTDAKWNERDKRWAFPSGATLTFGYMDHENDKFRYQGAAFQYVGFDELTQFTRTQYQYMLSRVRRLKGMPVPTRVRAASNPGGVGHEWVFEDFVDPTTASGRVFIPARMEDNPHLDVEEYRRALSRLDPVTRRQLEEGDWNVKPKGPLFERQWFTIVDAVPAGCRWVRYWDLAATEAIAGKDPDWTVGALLGLKDGVYYLADVQRIRAAPLGVEQLVAQTAALDRDRGLGHVDIWMEQEPGSSGVNTIAGYAQRVLVGFAFHGNRETGSKYDRARPVSSAAEAGNFKMLRGRWNTAFVEEAVPFPSKGIHDDQVDAVSGAFGRLSRPTAGFSQRPGVHPGRRM